MGPFSAFALMHVRLLCKWAQVRKLRAERPTLEVDPRYTAVLDMIRRYVWKRRSLEAVLDMRVK